MSLWIMNSDFGLYTYFKVAASLLRNSLISREGALYKLNIIRLDVLVTNWIADFKVLFLTVTKNINFTEMLICPNKHKHASLCRPFQQKLEPNMQPLIARCSSSSSTTRCSLKRNMWGFMLSSSKERINSSLFLLVSSLTYFLTLNMEVICSSETLGCLRTTH
jgi:hypothetical protein